MSLPDDIGSCLRIKLNMYKQAGLEPDSEVIVADIANYIVALLLSPEVRELAVAYEKDPDKKPARAGF